MPKEQRKTYHDQIREAFDTDHETQEAFLSRLSSKRRTYAILSQGLQGTPRMPRAEAAKVAQITPNNISNTERAILSRIDKLQPETIFISNDRFLSGQPEGETPYFPRIMERVEQANENELETLLEQLTPIQQTVIRSRAGLDGHEPRSRAETALDTGIHESALKFFEYGAYRKVFKPNDRKRPGE